MEGLAGDTTKIRKRGCSPSSSTSSVIQNYKFKRAILVGKRGGRGGSSTPVPSWRMVGSRSPSVVVRATVASSPRCPPSQPPVSARKLAATLWEMNEVPSPSPRIPPAGRRRKEKLGRSVCSGGSGLGSLPPHLSDPSHSPVSERMQRSGTGTHRRRESSISRRLTNDNFDSASNASFMEVETRSRCRTPSGSTVGSKTRMKDISNALTTSKELLKIISRMWGQHSQPSSISSLMSALHSELERARLQLNQLIQDEQSDHKEINYLIKRFAEEKSAWKNKEKYAVESISDELEVERKLRRRFESLNKKLGKELAETKEDFSKVVKELENEKRTREILEQVCDELARNIGEDKAQSSRIQEEIQKEREMLQIAEALREERTQMKISDAKHIFEEKNAAIDKVKSELEAFMKTKNSKRRDVDLVFCRSEARGLSNLGEVDDTVEDGENSAESDLHSIELNKDDPSKNYKLSYSSLMPKISKRHSVDEEHKGRKSIFNQVARRSTSLLRSMSNVVEWGNSSKYEIDKQVSGKNCTDEIQRHKSVRGVRDHTLPSSRLGVESEYASPSSKHGPRWPSQDPFEVGLQRPVTIEETRVEGHNPRRSRR